jgi:hypothetical protein
VSRGIPGSTSEGGFIEDLVHGARGVSAHRRYPVRVAGEGELYAGVSGACFRLRPARQEEGSKGPPHFQNAIQKLTYTPLD